MFQMYTYTREFANDQIMYHGVFWQIDQKLRDLQIIMGTIQGFKLFFLYTKRKFILLKILSITYIGLETFIWYNRSEILKNSRNKAKRSKNGATNNGLMHCDS